MPGIDLHTHSSASDGTTSPAALVRAAADAGLDTVAITDHDTTEGWAAAEAALPDGLRLVRGAEISCNRNGISLHLLGYLFDPHEPALAEQLRVLRDSRVSRAERMVEMLVQDGHPVSWDQVRDIADGTVGRPHVARALMQSGLVSSIEEAFTPAWIGTRGRYWAVKQELDVIDAMKLIHAAGGVTVFAHPGADARGRTVGDEVIEEMATAGLGGLEVDHVDHTPETRIRLRAMASALGLFVTGSSDFHGSNKQVQLGEHTTAPAVLDELTGRATGVAVL
ncbi:MAG: PHP domain-containing protein [Mycobacteriales bacterium]